MIALRSYVRPLGKKGGAGAASKWRYVSDSHVSAVSADEVLRKQAYMLFYERVDEEGEAAGGEEGEPEGEAP